MKIANNNNPDVVIRPITLKDLNALKHFADVVGSGLTSLPKDRNLLSKKIAFSVASFNKEATAPEKELYLFVIEDLAKGKVVGTCAIASKSAVDLPLYTYAVETHTQTSRTLKIKTDIPVLHLSIMRNGPSELCSLFLIPEYRASGLSRLLSLSRFLFIASFPHRFEPTLFAQMRGVTDNAGEAPFWNAVGRCFYNMEFTEADALVAKDKSFVAELVPTFPIYIPLLPKSAQEIIGQTHPHTTPALKLLEAEGFHWNNHVDLFDAGPNITCQTKHVKAIKESQTAIITGIADNLPSTPKMIISNCQIDFRATYGAIGRLPEQKAVISAALAKSLNVTIGDTVRYLPSSGRTSITR